MNVKSRQCASIFGGLVMLCGAAAAFAAHPLNQNPPPAEPSNSAVITNGLIKLGVKDEGNLNIAGAGIASRPSAFTTAVGLRLIFPDGSEAESTSAGCLCEGWGASAGSVSGFANVDVDGIVNLSLISFNATADSAESVVLIRNPDGSDVLEVTHDFHPSPETPNLYEVTVELKNVSGGDITDLRYRRTMDWDISPTEFSEYVTIDSGTAVDLAYVSNNGFDSSNPLSIPNADGFYYTFGDRTDDGPKDHGALFQFEFQDVNLAQPLAPGESKTFTIYYGAAFSESEAEAALAAVGAEAYSFGQPDVAGSAPDHGEPNTFIFAFGGVGGDSVFETFGKQLVAGPDVDEDGDIDAVVQVQMQQTSEFAWRVTANAPDYPPLVVLDTAPAEIVVEAVNADASGLPLPCGGETIFEDLTGSTAVFRGGRLGKDCQAATHLMWVPISDSESSEVSVSTRLSPGKGHKEPKYEPMDCGAFILNEGAVAYELDPATGAPAVDADTGELLPPLFESDWICVAAMADLDGDGLDYSGHGDEDGDGLADYAEACEVGTKPCDPDTDDDGVEDGLDSCPVEGPANIPAGETLDESGCIQ